MAEAAQVQVEHSEPEIIATYRMAVGRQAKARRCVSLIILGVVLVHFGIIVAVTNDFLNHRLPEFAAALSTEAAMVAPRFVADVRDMANRLYPHYSEVFQQMFERDWDTIESRAHAEMDELDRYAQAKWPAIEAGIVDLALTSEEVLKEELSRYISAEDARQISVAYGVALEGKYNELLTTTLLEHANVSREIGENLDRLIAAEGDTGEPVTVQESLGIMLELIGSELQQGL